jgi:uncharacterized protein YndB with AHSA1/START domain
MDDVKAIEIRQEVEIKATRARVFKALTDEIPFWWGAPFVHSQESVDIRVEKFVGGRVYEPLSDEKQGYLWGTVGVYVENEHLEIWGPIGMSGAVNGRVSFELTEAMGSTKLTMKHEVLGKLKEESLTNYSHGWKDLLENRLRRFIEKNEVLGMRAKSGCAKA